VNRNLALLYGLLSLEFARLSKRRQPASVPPPSNEAGFCLASASPPYEHKAANKKPKADSWLCQVAFGSFAGTSESSAARTGQRCDGRNVCVCTIFYHGMQDLSIRQLRARPFSRGAPCLSLPQAPTRGSHKRVSVRSSRLRCQRLQPLGKDRPKSKCLQPHMPLDKLEHLF
jgi:hypothetical protein